MYRMTKTFGQLPEGFTHGREDDRKLTKPGFEAGITEQNTDRKSQTNSEGRKHSYRRSRPEESHSTSFKPVLTQQRHKRAVINKIKHHIVAS